MYYYFGIWIFVTRPFTLMFSSPFEAICLSLSGGGFRSAAFSLGNLSYLNHIVYHDHPLAHRVTTITTASGGTFPGLRYALDQYRGAPFESTFQKTFDWLLNTNVFEEAISNIRNPEVWASYSKKRQSLINGAAVLYQESLFDNESLEVFLSKPEDELPPLRTFIGTSTEFKEGLHFRLAWSRVPESKILFGTWRWDLNFPKTAHSHAKGISPEALAEIRLGDIAATSSAFPGAFEPISFPDDFIPEKGDCLAATVSSELRQEIELKTEQLKSLKKAATPDRGAIREKNQEIQQQRDICNPPTALMDGGILDNQGLGAAFYAEKKLGKAKPYHSLFFVADNASYFVNDFVFEKPTNGKNWGPHHWLRAIQLGTSFILVVGLVLLFSNQLVGGISLTTLGSLFAGGLIFTSQWIRSRAKDTLENQNLKSYWKQLVRLPLPLLDRFIKERAQSIFLMVEQVFLKQIRSLYQDQLYSDDQYRNRRLISHLYLFLKPNTGTNQTPEYKRIIKNKATLAMLEKGETLDLVHEVVSDAYSMPLTLWFSESEKALALPQKLVATGQITACAMLIHHLVTVGVPVPGQLPVADTPFTTYAPTEQAELSALLSRLLEDWQQFKKNPMFLITSLLSKE